MNEELLLTIVSISGPLIGAIIGALIASLTSARLERSKWRFERQEKLSSLQREALAAALEWIEPLRSSLIKANSLVMAAIEGEFDHTDFITGFPNVLGRLAEKDLTAEQRAVLPGNYYQKGHMIVREFDNLQILGIKYGREFEAKKRPMVGLPECGQKLDDIEMQIAELETELQAAFQKTFK